MLLKNVIRMILFIELRRIKVLKIMNFKLLLLLSFLGISFYSTAQNCGAISAWSFTDSSVGAGNSLYTISFDALSTSGGTKGVIDLVVSCSGTTMDSNATCYPTAPSGSTPLSYTYTFTATTCTTSVALSYTGQTNNACGGTTCFSGFAGAPVPVELVIFTAERELENYVQLHWRTASELNNDLFEIQRKSEFEAEFKTIAQVSGAGNSNELIEYQYVDDINAVNGKICYRLKQVDYDNAFEYSDVACVKETTQKSISVYPNPVNASVTINTQLDGFSYEVCNSMGAALIIGKVEDFKTTIQTTELPSGIYYIKVRDYDGLDIETKKLSIL